jgi:3-hydroxyisobutyrate dehydrogenase-like beta-hydroxyacid dehydrogenase
MSESNHYALVGLGQMGLPICQRMSNIAKVSAFDIDPGRREMADGIDRVCTTDALGDLAGCTRIVLSLPSPSISQAVVEELAPQLAPGSVLIETSTVLPAHVRRLELVASKYGVHVVDAAILSGVDQMSSGAATLLVGGDPADLEKSSDILTALGPKGSNRFGALGAGMAAKVVNNGVSHAVMVVLTEAFSLSQSQHLNLDQIARDAQASRRRPQASDGLPHGSTSSERRFRWRNATRSSAKGFDTRACAR